MGSPFLMTRMSAMAHRELAELALAGAVNVAGWFSKRLVRGRFLWPSMADGTVTISTAQLGYLWSGIDWAASPADVASKRPDFVTCDLCFLAQRFRPRQKR
jgi:transposase